MTKNFELPENTELLKSIKVEIEGEIDHCSNITLPDLANELEAATVAHIAAVARHVDMQERIRRYVADRPAGRASASLAPRVATPVSHLENAWKEAGARRQRAHNAYVTMQRNLAELQQAIVQIDQILAPAWEETA